MFRSLTGQRLVQHANARRAVANEFQRLRPGLAAVVSIRQRHPGPVVRPAGRPGLPGHRGAVRAAAGGEDRAGPEGRDNGLAAEARDPVEPVVFVRSQTVPGRDGEGEASSRLCFTLSKNTVKPFSVGLFKNRFFSSFLRLFDEIVGLAKKRLDSNHSSSRFCPALLNNSSKIQNFVTLIASQRKFRVPQQIYPMVSS